MQPLLFAALEAPASLWEALFRMAMFGLVGIVLSIVGFKLFDIITPGNLGEEITKNKNVAAAIMAGAVIVAIGIIVSHAM